MLRREQSGLSDYRKNITSYRAKGVAQTDNAVWNPGGIGLRVFQDLRYHDPFSAVGKAERELSHSAKNLAAEGRYAEALHKLAQYRSSQPFDYRASFLEAQIFHLKARPTDAMDALEQTLRLRPDFIPAYLQIADIAADIGRHQCARAHLERALALLDQLEAGARIWPCGNWTVADLRNRVQRNIAASAKTRRTN